MMDKAATTPSDPRAAQRGAVLFWFLVTLGALLAMAVLLIDMARIQVNRQEQYYAARSIASAALLALSRAAPSEVDTKMLERVKDVGAELKILGDGSYSSSDVHLSEDGTDAADGGITVTPGYWLASAPASTSSISDCGPPYPCFSPRSGAKDAPSAMRVGVVTTTSNPILASFSGFLGTKSFRTREEAVVALLPRRVVLAVDLSRSMQADSHALLGPAESEYAYRPLSNVPSGCTTDPAGGDNTCKIAGCVEPADSKYPGCFTTCEMASPGGTSGPFNVSYNVGMASTVGGAGRRSDSPHVHEDYRCFKVQLPRSDAGATVYPMLVDMQSDPYPLSTALRALNRTLAAMQGAAMSGDGAGIIGFDTEVGYTLPTGIGRTQGVFSPGSPGWQTLVDLTTYTNEPGKPPAADSHNYERLKHGFYPIPATGPMFSNVTDALLSARKMLATAGGSATIASGTPARNYIVIASDGISNCRQTAAGMSCSDDYPGYTASRDIVRKSLTDLQAEGVKIVIFLFGSSGPHTLLIPREKDPADPECLTDKEAREKGVNYVDSSPQAGWGNESKEFDAAKQGNGYFFDPNSLYYSIAPAGGVWAPIRPCYRETEGGPCVNLFNWGSAPEYRNTCKKLAESSIALKSKSGSYARLLFDPYGRTPEEQAFDTIDEIMRDINITAVAHKRY